MASKISKHATCVYLHNDGHAVVMCAKSVRVSKGVYAETRWVELVEYLGPMVAIEKGHRVVLGNIALARLCESAQYVTASVPNLSHGSQSSREHGIPVGSLGVKLHNQTTFDRLYFYDMPGFMSGPYSLTESSETWDDVKETRWWSDVAVLKVINEKEAAHAK